MAKNIAGLQEVFSTFLAAMETGREPRSLYAPADYIMTLGGKRLRPLLTLMGCELFGRPAEDALPAAMAVEIFHNFSLVHDDIMDQAPLRRGMPTVHEKYGLNAGILSGDVMLIDAYRSLCRCPADASLARLMERFNRMAAEVCEGQALDMEFERRNDVTLPEYLRMIEQKTAALIGAGLALGAVIAGASPEEEYHIDAFGRHIGIAFQIQDDLLDTFGDPDKFGKKTGGDIVQNKKTFLLLKALEVADEKSRAALLSWYEKAEGDESEKIEEVKSIFQTLRIPEQTEAAKASFQRTAFEHLRAINTPDDRKAPIIEFSDWLFQRDV
ncbi:MAG: polyprenyl synthetase family protein [Saprospiraceae bacterium]|nr:polyprenyl synthetase family protein [Saprospiraceae bacterium]